MTVHNTDAAAHEDIRESIEAGDTETLAEMKKWVSAGSQFEYDNPEAEGWLKLGVISPSSSDYTPHLCLGGQSGQNVVPSALMIQFVPNAMAGSALFADANGDSFSFDFVDVTNCEVLYNMDAINLAFDNDITSCNDSYRIPSTRLIMSFCGYTYSAYYVDACYTTFCLQGDPKSSQSPVKCVTWSLPLGVDYRMVCSLDPSPYGQFVLYARY